MPAKPRDFGSVGAYVYHRTRHFYQARVMGTQLNIKSEDAYRLASRLSELTGESLTAVVTRALRAELEREENARDRDARKVRLRAIAREVRAGLPPDMTSNHDFLYDDATGLPK